MRYLVLLFLSACASLGPLESKPVDPLYTYKADIKIGFGTSFYDGFASGKLLDRHNIMIESKAALDLLTISTCHRSFSTERVDPDWFGGVGHTYVYTYVATPLEKKDFCPMYIQAFNASGSTSWGFVAFQSEESLGFSFQCNGSFRELVGVGICQAQINQIQGLSFHEEIQITASPECKLEMTVGSQDMVFSSSGGFCLITAKAKADPKRFARILLLGYKNLHVR